MDVSGTIGAVLNQKSREIYSVSPDATVFEAVQLMDAKNVGALLVMDGQRLVGIVSERDYTRKIMLRGRRSRETKVAEIMSTNVFTTHRREGVETCLRLMTDQRIRHCPCFIVDNWLGVSRLVNLLNLLFPGRKAPFLNRKSSSTAVSLGVSCRGRRIGCELQTRQPARLLLQ